MSLASNDIAGWIEVDLRFIIACLENGVPREQIVEFIRLDMLEEEPEDE